MYYSVLAFAGITSHIAIDYLQSERGLTAGQRLWSEWVAWGLLYLLCRLGFQPRVAENEKQEDTESQPPLSSRWTRANIPSSLTILAVLFVGAQLVEHYAGETLKWPTPLLTVTTFATSILVGQSESASSFFDQDFLHSWQALLPRSIGQRSSQIVPILVFLTVSIVSAIVCASQSQSTMSSSVLPGVLFLILATGIYTLLGVQVGTLPSHASRVSHTHRSLLRPLAIRAFALWTLYLAILAPQSSKLNFLTLVAGILRSTQIYAMVILTIDGAGLAATAMNTSAIGITSSFVSRTSVSAMTACLVAVGSLLQTTATLPKSATSRNVLFFLLLLPMASVLNLHGVLHFGPTHSLTKTSSYGTTHPIEDLVDAGNFQFAQMLSSQSKTLREAVLEYQKRYHRKPPPGFDKWFEMAQEKDYLLVDEFDTIMESMEPFWGTSPQTLQARIESIVDVGSIIHFKIRNNTATWDPEHYHTDMLGEWLQTHAERNMIPDMDLKINVLDEPRVLAPYDTVAQATENVRSHYNPGRLGNTDVDWISVGQQDSWAAMLTSCSINSPARSEYYDDSIGMDEGRLPFVSNVTTSMDVCANAELHNKHGFFQSPDTLQITRSFVPILSQCAPTIFNDILYPSPYYAHKMISDNIGEVEDVDWDQKLDRVYWSGTATGAHVNTKTWMHMHRQRLALLVAPDSTALVSLLRRGANGVWQTYQSTWAKISSMFYFRITATAQCDEDACEEMKQRFGSEWEPLNASLASKYAIDMDGNTFSGRYYRLLKSKSCVLKLTVFREWHDGRLTPWVHYVPVSPGAEELGELVRFLVQDNRGKNIGRKIADQGRTWANKILRREDLEVAFFRVLLEYNRLVSLERDNMYFDG